MRNIRLIVAYDGTDFHGWQRQPEVPTIQACLEEVIQKLTGTPVQVCGSGRTDAGVHALHQVANFQTSSPIPCTNLVKALNDLLPPTVRIRAADEVGAEFHARYGVRAKTYRYRILQAPICSPLLWRYVCHCPYLLDRMRMAEAARLFEGEHDFTSFAAADEQVVAPRPVGAGAGPAFCGTGATSAGASLEPGATIEEDEESKSMVRVIFRSRFLWRPRSSLLVYEVTGEGFLRYMVRNMVGTLLEVGKGKLAPSDVTRILAARDRAQAGPTAPAQGLCLVSVEYEDLAVE
jgi:tRNA pseudouridine38-40 synthase